MPKQIHLAIRVDADSLLNKPDMIMQQMSLKIFQRREQLIADLENTKVTFIDDNGKRIVGTVESFDDGNAIIRDGSRSVRVSSKKIEFI
tara:strand:- start:100 stop:366 length:267 start_codon:yes stop_codon:yes gene_type:complete